MCVILCFCYSISLVIIIVVVVYSVSYYIWLGLCHASSASIGTVVIAYVYHDASPATLA